MFQKLHQFKKKNKKKQQIQQQKSLVSNVKAKSSKLILDAGVNFKDVQKALNFDFKSVQGVLVTHEHMDHLKYAPNFAMNGVDVYASAGTFLKLDLKGHRFKVVQALQQFTIGDFTILPFDTQHDAAEPLRIFNTI